MVPWMLAARFFVFGAVSATAVLFGQNWPAFAVVQGLALTARSWTEYQHDARVAEARRRQQPKRRDVLEMAFYESLILLFITAPSYAVAYEMIGADERGWFWGATATMAVAAPLLVLAAYRTPYGADGVRDRPWDDIALWLDALVLCGLFVLYGAGFLSGALN